MTRFRAILLSMARKLSRRFYQIMVGDFTVESEPDCRSTFTIHLPRIVDAPAEAVLGKPIKCPDRGCRFAALHMSVVGTQRRRSAQRYVRSWWEPTCEH
jgi:hypothetical protein